MRGVRSVQAVGIQCQGDSVQVWHQEKGSPLGLMGQVFQSMGKNLHSTVQGTAQKNETHVHTITLRQSISSF